MLGVFQRVDEAGDIGEVIFCLGGLDVPIINVIISQRTVHYVCLDNAAS
jgi:hypothetical protein